MTRLSGLRILVVEDEYLLSRQVARALTALGADVVGCAAGVAAALDSIARLGAIDLALLDVNLAGEKVYPVADELVRRGIGFVFLSGYDLDDRDPRFAGWPQLSKPVTMPMLVAALETATNRMPAPAPAL